MKIAAIAIASVLVLSGCATEPKVEATVTPASDLWSDQCEQYVSPQGTEPFELAYEMVIEDLCSKQAAYDYELNYEVSDSVDKGVADKFTDGLIFSLDYWSNYAPSFAPANFVIFTENDQIWWEEKQKKYLKKPELGWFTSKSEGWHCRVEADIFCPKNYMPDETNVDQRVEFRIIGSQLKWEPRHNVNMVHEAVHAYQDELGFSHYREWFVEGQATFFELAFAYLYYEFEEGRANYLTQPQVQDAKPFKAKTPNEVLQHIESCRTQNNPCDNFKYGVGMMYHEKLVIDHGLETYMSWMAAMDKSMPKGNPSTYDQQTMRKMETEFAGTFEQVFGQRLDEFETEVMPKYIIDSYAAHQPQ